MMRSKLLAKKAFGFVALAAMCFTLTLSGCGGGGDGAVSGIGGGQKFVTVTGSVRDVSGKPIQDATVEARDFAGNLIATARSDANGEFKLTLPVGVTVTVTASVAGSSASTSITPREGYNPPIALTLVFGPLMPPPPPTFPE